LEGKGDKMGMRKGKMGEGWERKEGVRRGKREEEKSKRRGSFAKLSAYGARRPASQACGVQVQSTRHPCYTLTSKC